MSGTVHYLQHLIAECGNITAMEYVQWSREKPGGGDRAQSSWSAIGAQSNQD